MPISIEVPVFKGAFLRACIDSVLAQTSDQWTLSLLWDGGDAQSHEILRQLATASDPRIQVFFAANQGIAASRRFLTDHSHGDYILPLDDDDLLPPQAVARFCQVASGCPWASLIRARRDFVDTTGAVVDQEPWFPFGPRQYFRGMVTDVFNQAQPYLIRRSAYERTRGWTGFAGLMGAGEDCDIFLQLERVGNFELIDEALYHYRLHDTRASHALTPAAAFQMWRDLADSAIVDMRLPLRRVNHAPPFAYEEFTPAVATLADVDFVVRGADSIAARSLRRCGVADDAIHAAETMSGLDEWRMAGFRETRRRLVSFVDAEIEILDEGALHRLVQTLDGASADVLAPRLMASSGSMLVRPATVGLDPEGRVEGIWRTRSEARNVIFPAWLSGEFLLMRREVMLSTGGIRFTVRSDDASGLRPVPDGTVSRVPLRRSPARRHGLSGVSRC